MKKSKEEELLLVEEVNRLISMIEEARTDGRQKQVGILTDQLENTLNLLTAVTREKKRFRILVSTIRFFQ